jgi:hypothetical protein
MSTQSTLMASGVILVNEPLVHGRIDHRNRGQIGGLCGFFITAFDSFYHFLYISSYPRAETRIMLSTLLCLPSAFCGGSYIGQLCTPDTVIVT